MSYPESANVSSGDATLATHYNNLRADAVHLGQVAADSVDLGTMLERYESRLTIERLDTTKLRVIASASAPVSLLIDGFLCQAVANVDLAAGEVPVGVANVYYIFANRVGASTTFTLTVSVTFSEAANNRRIGRFYWDGSKIIKDSVRTELADHVADLLYFIDPQICAGRLSISTGIPIPSAEIASSANVYFTPFHGNRVALYVNDYGWRLYSFSELTLDISGVAEGNNIDVWLYDDAGTLTLAYTQWSNDTLRATSIVRQDGVLVKNNAPEYRYLGTVRTSGAGVTCDTFLKRYVWNFYHRAIRILKMLPATDDWTYATAEWRKFNDDDGNRVSFLIGVDEEPVKVNAFLAHLTSTTATCGIGLGLDSITVPHTDPMGTNTAEGTTPKAIGHAMIEDHVGIGFHYVQWLEYGAVGFHPYLTVVESRISGLTGFLKG